MSNSERIDLFSPEEIKIASPTFWIADQLTVVAFGLVDDDEITFEAISTPAVMKDPCSCPPLRVTLPSVADKFPLQCCGESIKLTQNRPYVILDAPQYVLLRAVMNAKHPELVRAWAVPTRTPNPTPYMRGCACEERARQV